MFMPCDVAPILQVGGSLPDFVFAMTAVKAYRTREAGRRPVTFHARQAAEIRMTLLTTERLFWHSEYHTAKPKSADSLSPKSAVFYDTW